jgi:transposase
VGFITFVGLDVHKDTIAVAIASNATPRNGAEYRGEILNEASAVRKLCDRLKREGGELHFCYEAGPCGYELYRHLVALGHACDVVAPSLIPVRTGDRIKTDRRDAVLLARLHRAGELTAVWVPDHAHEAMRDLVRAREAAKQTLTRARQHLKGFLLRHGRSRAAPRGWTLTYRRWLADQKFEHPAQQIVLQDYIGAVSDAEARVKRLDGQIAEFVPSWSLAPVIAALQAMRGIGLLCAVTLAAEIGDFTRFPNPRQLMAYLGLVPSESSSGARIRRAGITKAGNSRARRILVEGAWTYRLNSRVGRHKVQHLDTLPKAVRDIAWKAQIRLCAKYRKLLARGTNTKIASVAIAREMIGFAWAIACHVQVRPTPA